MATSPDSVGYTTATPSLRNGTLSVRPVIDTLMQQITPQQTQPPKDPE